MPPPAPSSLAGHAHPDGPAGAAEGSVVTAAPASGGPEGSQSRTAPATLRPVPGAAPGFTDGGGDPVEGSPAIDREAAGGLLARSRERRGRGLPPLRGDNLGGVLRLACKLHEADHLDEAARLYERIIDADERSPDALHLYGLLRAQRGDHVAAAGLLEQSVRLRRSVDSLQALGQVYFEMGQFDRAAARFGEALALAPDNVEALRNLGHAWFNLDRFKEAAEAYRDLAEQLPEDGNVWASLGFACIHLDDLEAARDAFARAVDIEPDDEEAAHLYAALSGDCPERAPDTYVRGLFDRYAEGFDRHLLTRLQYRVPEHFRELVDGLLDAAPESVPPVPWRIADLGCGTGLCGAAFADLAAELVGVDLSPRMLERCAHRRLYDELVEASLVDWLEGGTSRHDLVLAGDVLIYMGALEPVFERLRDRMAPHGLILLSTESCGGQDYELRRSGRFAHSIAYLDRAAAASGLELVARQPTVVRVERGAPITGHVTVLRARATALGHEPRD